MKLSFLDTNTFLRHLLQDDPIHSPKASAFLKRIEEGLLEARTSETVIFETVFTLQKVYRQPKAAIRDTLLPLLELPGIVLLEQLNLTETVSFDTDFDRIKGITRKQL
jgi:predicted nucleic acid-binding protein